MSADGAGPVLVVDDHPLNRLLLERILELEGYATVTADSLAQAEQILDGILPALIILDIRLADGDGLELARRLTADPTRPCCAIIACSAGSETEERRRALGAGCDAYVAKPIEIRDISELVASLVPQSPSRPVVS